MSAAELSSDRISSNAAQKKRTRDADILILLWDLMRTRDNEIDHLLDLALSALSSAPSFSEKTDLQRSLEKARSLLGKAG